ncbi:MAG: aminopeptidase P family protein [Ignavibacteriota bacterium]|nr:aminopeptidase P family protein [Ignavibacteriota bacterium]MCO6448686.1 aminopeptidase P family protein [Ignavibacterium album]MCZ2269913.1 aminopeptidase P family protein [Ignavibacteriales bacterium]HOJ08441.1 aminopeptidase P family protein [Ignavibacteriaceae bacterium]MEB2355721.1 aminopeptidase P family protein [Ignavibacteriales bacterium]
MFDKQVYIDRRNELKKSFKSGVLLFPGNDEAAMNYPGNTYKFRQDSSFLYYFGIDIPGMTGLIDLDEDKEYLFGYEFTIEDTVWMGPQPKLSELAGQTGVEFSKPIAELKKFLKSKKKKQSKIHFLPPYRAEHILKLSDLLDENPNRLKSKYSKKLIEAVVAQRSIKAEEEIAEIEYATEIAYQMHTTAMRMAKPGVIERDIAGAIEGIALSIGNGVSFHSIVSKNGQTLHNHFHGNVLKEGDLLVCDAGAESLLHYASDITRTTPVGGKFSYKQKEIYEIVLTAQKNAINMIKPDVKHVDVHLTAVKIIAAGLSQLGLMKGDLNSAVKAGAHALFMPHGLGHMMGLDVHDMENLGEDYVGYDNTTKRSDQFGLSYLRLAKELKPGFVFTCEPGIYFIPELIDLWKSQKKFKNFINYDKVEEYRDFGGIRIEDNILVTKTGYKVLGRPIPKEADDVEAWAKS